MQRQGESDKETMVTFSVMIWHTPEFGESFQSDQEMDLFLDILFDILNQAFINSQIPVTLQNNHC